MKKYIVAAALSIPAALSFASEAPSKELVERYLKVSQIQKMTEAQVDSYIVQYSQGKDAEFKSKVQYYLNSVMGWDALKDEYVALVQETFNEKEIKASLAFMESPIGRSLAQKNITFSSKMSTIAAKKVQQVASATSQNKNNGDDNPSDPTISLSVANIEEMQSGDATYFTGEIHNKGKSPARGVNIEVNLFMGKKFVDQYTTYITGSIPPGGIRLFKISCGCKGNPPAKHDSYKIEISNGY